MLRHSTRRLLLAGVNVRSRLLVESVHSPIRLCGNVIFPPLLALLSRNVTQREAYQYRYDNRHPNADHYQLVVYSAV